MAKLQTVSITKRTVDRLSVEDRDAGVLGPGPARVRGTGISVRRQGLRGSVPRERSVAAGDARPVRAHDGRSCAPKGARSPLRASRTVRTRRARAEPSTESAPGKTVAEAAERYMREHVAIHCKATSAKMYRRLLDTFILPTHWRCAGCRGHARARGEAALSVEEQTLPSESSARNPEQDIQSGGGLGMARREGESVPSCTQVHGEQA